MDMSDLLLELECPVCNNYLAPPIRQCSIGHSICDACRNQLSKCPLCQSFFTESKNLALEALARKLRYPCINRSSGCKAHLTFDVRESHELNCTYKEFKCAMERCSWVGRLHDIPDHWASKTIKSKPYQINNICHFKIKFDSYYANLVEAYNEHFWFKSKSFNRRIFWAVQYIGTVNECNKFYFEIEVFKPGKPKCKMILSEYCMSINIDNSHLFKEDKCVSVALDSLKSYVGTDKLLIYYMRINEVNNCAQKKCSGKSHEAVGFS